ncbi:alpha/beta hydrolase-fold protein [uncultured Leifsonia sp.]|uniref:alpha/beta hydrolase n=1 Tax=uncultured Leifsonia sp. TaxID=340359 RepID=UPI0028D2EFBC|nr:alpha/beta hydrolase-fold protein [uncultured Leifsonia sp.]
MPTIAWLCLILAALAALPAMRFAGRAWRLRATPTVLTIVTVQVAALAGVLLWAHFAPRPDLAGGGWWAIGLAAVTIPLAIGDAIQSRGAMRVVSAVLTAAMVVVTVGVGVVVLRPTLSTVTVAGQTIPLTAQNLRDGAQLTVDIPPTASRFSARPAKLFVPPGWLRHPSGTRPIVTMMMGQPGSPRLGPTVDALHSLGQQKLDDAPFILDVDQLGGSLKNPPCANSSAGQVETYLARDVPAWIRSNLPVSSNRLDWGLAGYSHGGECAAYLGAAYPAIWSKIVSVGGPDKPGEHKWRTLTLARYWHGNLAAYEKTWPAKVMAATSYAGKPMTAVFIAGMLDRYYTPQVETNAMAAEKAGWTVTFWRVPGAEHTRALVPGLASAYDQFIPQWLGSGAIVSAPGRVLCTPDQTPRDCGVKQAVAVVGTATIVDLSVLAVFLGARLVLLLVRRPRSTRDLPELG